MLLRRSMSGVRSPKMRIVGLDYMRSNPPMSLVTASLAAARASHAKVQTLVLNTATEPLPKVISRVQESASEVNIVGIGAYVWAEQTLRPVIDAVRSVNPSCDVVMGGPQVTDASVEELADAYPGVSQFVRGSGEATLRSFTHAPPLQELPSPLLQGWLSPHPFMR